MTTTKPFRCSYSAMAQRGAGNEVVLLNTGNYPAFSNYLNETWTFDGVDYTRAISATANGPLPVRTNMAMCYDGYNILMFGGQSGHQSLSDSWTFNGTSWTKETPATVPFGRFKSKLALLNTVAPKAVMFGGTNILNFLSEVWVWDGNLKTWTLGTPTNKPPARVDHMFAGGATVCVLFGGKGTNNLFGDTWSFDGSQFSQNTPTTPPPPRAEGCLVYDPVNDLWVLFGGRNDFNVLQAETWTLNSNRTAWTQQSPTLSPTGRVGAQMCYDDNTATVLLNGGSNGAGTVYNDSWSFNTTTMQWAQI